VVAREETLIKMKRLIVIAILGFLMWQGYAKYQSNSIAEISSPLMQRESTSTSQFKCDGRTYCSQMTSCAEATFFLKNCPGVKMDGNNDGVPCEQQWCR
jgi:hypothetical protein